MNKQLQLREAELEYKALCKEHPEEKDWQEHILRRINRLKKELVEDGS
jgi:hypothetical protein